MIGKESASLIKKSSAVVILIISFVSCVYFGIVKFSSENIDNYLSGYKSGYYSNNGDLILENWTRTENGYVSSNEDPQIIINGDIGEFIKNIRLDGMLDNYENVTVRFYYTEEPEEVFSEEKLMVVPPEKKNGDIYFRLEKKVCKLRIDLYSEAGRMCEINGIEINPMKLNFNVSVMVCSFGIPFLILTAAYMSIFNRDKIKVYFAGIKKYRFLLWDLVTRDIKTKYRRSVLGILWSVLNPLLMMLVLTAVFANVFRFDIKDFPVYYLTGSVIFNFVSEATTGSMTSILGASGLIKKVYVPKYIFPMEKCAFAFVNLMFSMIAVIIVFIILGITPHWTMILFFVPIIYALIFSFGLSLVLATFEVFFRDTAHLYGVFVTAWMYVTPIIYPINILPDWMLNIVKLNPLYYYVEYFRNIMIYGHLPGIQENLVCVTFSGIMLLIGLALFKSKQDKFILYI